MNCNEKILYLVVDWTPFEGKSFVETRLSLFLGFQFLKFRFLTSIKKSVFLLGILSQTLLSTFLSSVAYSFWLKLFWLNLNQKFKWLLLISKTYFCLITIVLFIKLLNNSTSSKNKIKDLNYFIFKSKKIQPLTRKIATDLITSVAAWSETSWIGIWVKIRF